MRQRQLAILLLGLTLAPSRPSPAQQPQRPPRVVAFVVGIEQYAEERLNGLRFVAEDAYRVWNGLRAISDFDETRSTLLVADRVRMGALPPATAGMLTRDRITTELERFLGRTRSGDTAVLYFGGHGKVGFEDYGVSFLASNFADDGFVNAIFMRRVIEDARARTANKNVPIVVLANMCHAGAPGVYDPDQAPGLREMSDAGERDVPRTSKAVAYIPAAGGQTTYEADALGGSLFVKHLESLLQGGAADEYGRVTSGSLIRKLQERMAEIPRIGAFDDSIMVGRTGRQEAAYRRTLGIALLAAALDDSENPQLLRLAERQFSGAADRWQTTRAANLLSLADVQFLLGRDAEAQETLRLAQQEAAVNADVDVKKRVTALPGPGSTPSTAGLSVLLLDGYGRVRAGSATSSEAALWVDMFTHLPQHRQSFTIDVPFPVVRGPDDFLAQSETVVRGWRQAAAADDMLVVVYSGVASVSGARSTSPPRADELRPVSGPDLWTLARLWDGPVVVIFDAPFGGVLRDSVPPDLAPRTALWLSAGQTSGMTFGGGRLPSQQGTTGLMVEATRAGLSVERIKTLGERHRALFADMESSDFQVGVPEWLGPLYPPFWPTTHGRLALHDVLKWSWWSDSVASAGRLDVAADDLSPAALRTLRAAGMAAAAGRWRDAARMLDGLADLPVVALRLAALHETLGEAAAARANYERYLAAAAAAGARPPAAAPEAAAVVENARARQRSFVERIRQRADALTPARARIHFVGAAVQEYVLPDIADLSFPVQDIEMWKEGLARSFGDRVVVHPVLRDRSAADIRAALETVAAETTEHDLVLLVYSGRALEQDGQKYLAGADARLTRLAQFQVVASTWDASRLLSVSDVARIFAKRDLVMIVDAQMSAPRRDEMAARHKHIASIQGGEPDAPFIDRGPTRRYPAPADLRRHLYVWWEGVLGESLADETNADGATSSPLTRALVQALPGGETYAEWIERAGSLLRAGDYRSGEAFGRLAVQGPEYRPLMSAGVSLEQAIHLALQVDRQEANLEIGSSWANQHANVWTLPDDTLARAALLVSLGRVRLQRGAMETATFEGAIALLDGLRREAATLEKEGLLSDYVHWYTAALDEGLQDPDRALGVVIEIIGDDRDRQPAPELVARLLQLTERAASTTAAEKLRRSRDLLRSLQSARGDSLFDSAIGRLESLLRDQLRTSRSAGITMQ